MDVPRASILVPTLNAESDLARLLPAVLGQRVEGGFELVCVDSDSRDCTRQMLREAGARVTRIERADFRHGATRNLLASLARGEQLVFLSQDAEPAGEDCVERLLAPLADARVAAACARMLPRSGDDPLTARTALAAPEAGERSEVRGLEAGRSLAELPPEERSRLARFSDVASAFRASALAELPFPDVPFGEDSAWAALALERGWRLAFAADARVYHAHRYTPARAFERYRVDAAFQRRVHGLRVRPDLASLARGLAFELREDARFVVGRGLARHHLLRAPALRAAQVLGQYFGSRGWNPGRGGEATRDYA